MLNLGNAIRRLGTLGVVTGLLAVSPCIAAQTSPTDLPNKPIRLVVPYVAGGTPDVLGRIIAAEVSKRTGTQVYIDNRAGAGGSIGAQAVKQSAADGLTLLMCSFPCTTVKSLYAKPPYDIETDFRPVIQLVTVPSVLVVHPSVPANNLDELLALAKEKPGTISAANSGIGTSPHLASLLLMQQTGTRFLEVPYKGAAAATIDLLGGTVQTFFDNLPTSMAHIENGKLRALAVASTHRAAAAPDIPTFAEAGVQDFIITPWYGIMAPRDTPPAIVTAFNEAFAAALTSPTVQQKLRELGAEPVGGSPEDFARFIAAESQKWGTLIKQNGISAD